MGRVGRELDRPTAATTASFPGVMTWACSLGGGQLPAGPVVVHCQVGQRGHTAARILAQHGFDVVNLDGGYRTWAAGAATRERESVAA